MPKKSLTPSKNHDFTDQFWGHRISVITPLKEQGVFSMMGHGEGIQNGDTLTMKMQSGRIGKFDVRKVKYLIDPHDMFEMVAAITGYAD